MKTFLYGIVEIITKIHQFILGINDNFEANFTDKELHFLVIGILGVVLVLAIYPLFKWLAKHNRVMIITWIYVFTLIVVLTFAIEIGQRITGTGTMDFADVMFGVVGFLAMFAVCMFVRGAWHLSRYIFRKVREKKTQGKEAE